MAPIHRMPLRGRDEQLARATAVLASASVDGHAGAVMVRGPAGSGKSRLLRAVADDAVARGFRLLEGRGDADATSMPMAPLLQSVLAGTPPLMDRRAMQDALRHDDARYVVVEMIMEALEETARTQPLLVAIDDLQFSDPTTMFALRVMVERLAAEPVVWVIATREPIRDDAVAKTIDRLESLESVSLSMSSLTPTAARLIAEDLVGGSLGDNLQRMVDRADGEVLDLVETLRGLIDERRIDVVAGRADLTGSAVPIRLRDSIARRLARLDPAAVDVVTAAAVVGRAIATAVIAALLGILTDEVSAALRFAEHEQLVVNINGQWAFRHDLIREAVELALPPERRRELRRGAVDAQLTTGAPVAEVATALAATATTGDSRAAELLEQAARDVASIDPSGGADLVGRAAAISVGDSAAHGRLLAQQVMLLWQAGRAPDAQRIGEQALVAGLDPLRQAEVRLGLARVTSEHSYLEAGRQAATALALPGIPNDMRAKLLATLCVTKIMTDDFEGLESELGTALELARASDDRASEASLLATRSTLSMHQMNWVAAFEEAERGRRVAEDMPGETSMWAPKALWQAILLSTAGSCGPALAITDQGIADAAAARHGSAMSLWMMIRSRVLLEAGRLADAQAEAESVLAMTDWRERSTMADYTVHFVLRRVAQYTGEPAALTRSQSGAAAMARDGVSSVRRQGKWLAAIDADADGRPDVAVELTAEGVDAYGGLGNAFSLDPSDEPLFARIASRAARPDLAIKAAEFTERRAERNPHVPFLVAIAKHTRGLVDDDPGVLREAVDLFADTKRPLPRAAALEDVGRLQGNRDTAIHYLDQAHNLYADAGALRDAARVRQRLRGFGQRRRQPRQSDASGDKLAGLTPSELAVVELVARGATNREVAAQLYLSPHTVSTHLRHAFTKVGVRSRTELARITTLREKAKQPRG